MKKKPRRVLSDDDLAAAFEMRSEGLFIKHIAEAYSMHPETLKKTLQRAAKRGMRPKVEVNGPAPKLTFAQKLNICIQAAQGAKQEVLALEYGVSQTIVSHIIRSRKT